MSNPNLSISKLLDTNYLREGAWRRQHPEFADEVEELALASQHAAKMLKAGKITAAEKAELEAHFHGKFIDALPTDIFGEMMKDGRLEQLQALAGHDGERDGSDVADSRVALMNKIKADALDEAWLSQKITSEQYARENAEINRSEDQSNRIADGDHDGAASEYFASRSDNTSHDADLQSFMSKTYGKDYRGREEAPRVVAKETRTETRKEDDADLTDTQRTLRDKLGEIAVQEPRSAVDSNGITDLDVLAEQEG